MEKPVGQEADMTPDTLTLTRALDLFEDNLIDILDATAANLRDELAAFDRQFAWVEELSGLERELADEVKRLAFEETIQPALKRTERIARVIEEQTIRHPRGKRITESDIERAREHPVAELYDGKLVKRGHDLWGVCPFHVEKSPSFHITVRKNLWYCHGACHNGGDAIRFYQKLTGATFPAAVRYLARI